MKKILIALMFPVTALACDKEVCLSQLDLPCMNQETALYQAIEGIVLKHYELDRSGNPVNPHRFDYDEFIAEYITDEHEFYRFMRLFRYDDTEHFKSLVLKEIERISVIDSNK